MSSSLHIQSISKRYMIRHDHVPYLSLREQISGIFRRGKTSKEEFWALKDISFEVQEGESYAIIGRNGAGKSTLLKVLSRITSPTSGKVKVNGRLSSLLEVGTGFHPELTGRENIFLNGIILGMTKTEVKRRFDEIVDFSGTEKFLDTQLKHFSSGMQLRLAFSVAAFLEPEILVIDEVLAVGDAEFQRKCMNKMEDVSRSGRTILFVSHNMAAVQHLCSRAVWLDSGKLNAEGKTEEIIRSYLVQNLGLTSFEQRKSKSKKAALSRMEVKQLPSGNNTTLKLEAVIECAGDINAAFDVRLQSYTGEPAAFGSCGTFQRESMLRLKAGENIFIAELDLANVANGLYSLSIDLTNPHKEYYDRAEQILMFEYAYHSNESEHLTQDWNLGFHRLPLLINRK